MVSEVDSKPLGDLCDPDRGITYGIVKVGDYVAGGVPVIRGGDIREGRIVFDGEKRVSEEVSQQFKRTILRGGEILVNLIAEPGHTAIVPPELAGANVSRDVAVIALNDEINHKYVDYCLKSPMAVSWLNARLQGSVTQKINLGTLRDLPIPTLPRHEQQAIAHVLSTLDGKVELNRRMNETLEGMARALFKSWFVDFDPVRHKDEGQEPKIPEHVANLFGNSFKDSRLGRIPSDWGLTRLGDVLSVIETGGRPKGGVRDITEGVPSVGAESIVGIGHFDYGKTKFVPREFFNDMKKGHVQHLDVLLYKDGGRPGVYEPHVTIVGDGFPFAEFCINEHVYRLRTDPTLPQGYLFFWLTSEAAMQEMRTRGTGVAIPGLNSTAVRELAVLEPSVPVLEVFEHNISPIVQSILCNCKESRTLTMLRDTLLPRLISGELRLRDVDRIVGEIT